MDNREIKQANRKALPKFLLILAISMVVSGVMGYASARYGLNELGQGLNRAGDFFGTHIAPWLLLTVAIFLPAICVPLYFATKKRLASWDGENEEISDSIDRKLSGMIWLTGAALIVSYFFIAASYSGGFAMLEKGGVGMIALSIAAFLTIMAEAVLLQQKCVDMAKQMNPEKKGSVYDMKFQERWIDSCDEAEKSMIGKCAYRAYTATNTACAFLAPALAICALIFGIGFLPSLVVCIVWIVNQSAYCREALRYSTAGNKIL